MQIVVVQLYTIPEKKNRIKLNWENLISNGLLQVLKLPQEGRKKRELQLTKHDLDDSENVI